MSDNDTPQAVGEPTTSTEMSVRDKATMAREKLKEELRPVFQSPEQREAERERANEEQGKRQSWYQDILERFRSIIDEQVSLKGTANPQVGRNANRVKDLLYGKRYYADEDKGLRGLTMCAWVLAFAECMIKEQAERLLKLGKEPAGEEVEQLRSLRVQRIMESRIASFGFMLRDDKKGRIKYYGRRYLFTALVKNLPEAAVALAKIAELVQRARHVDFMIDRHELKLWLSKLGNTTISQDEFIAGKGGYYLAYTQMGAGQNEGVVLWYSNGEQVQAHRAFGHPGRFAENRELLEVWMPRGIIVNEQKLSGNAYIPDKATFRKASMLQKLWLMSRQSDQGRLQRHLEFTLNSNIVAADGLVGVVPKPEPVVAHVTPETSEEPVNEAVPEAAKAAASEEPESGAFPCKFKGCDHAPFKREANRNKHMETAH